jgi:hypothetical protein
MKQNVFEIDHYLVYRLISFQLFSSVKVHLNILITGVVTSQLVIFQIN